MGAKSSQTCTIRIVISRELLARSLHAPASGWGLSESPMRQLPVFDSMRLIGVLAFAAMEILLIARVVPVEPLHGAVAFKGQDVRRHAIEEPAIVRHDDGATREIFQRLFQRAD